MAFSKTDKPANVTPLRDVGGAAAVKPPERASFNFAADDDDAPEMAISTAAPKAAAPKAAGPNVAKKGADLLSKKKVIFFVGRGKTGKTTLIRWLSETALASDGSFLMADMDPTNDTFSKYIDGVARPSLPVVCWPPAAAAASRTNWRAAIHRPGTSAAPAAASGTATWAVRGV